MMSNKKFVKDVKDVKDVYWRGRNVLSVVSLVSTLFALSCTNVQAASVSVPIASEDKIEKLLEGLQKNMNANLELDKQIKQGDLTNKQLNTEVSHQGMMSGKIVPVYYSEINGHKYALLSLSNDGGDQSSQQVAKIMEGDKVGGFKIIRISPTMVEYSLAGVSHTALFAQPSTTIKAPEKNNEKAPAQVQSSFSSSGAGATSAR